MADNYLYFKSNGEWIEVSKVYKKINGAWVEQSDLSAIFTTVNCKKENTPGTIAYEASNLVFSGSNYINTNVQLFSDENISRDFELFADITPAGVGGSTVSLITCKKEGGATCGFIIRINRGSAMYSGNITIDPSTPSKITMRRISGVYTLEGNTYASNFPPANVAHEMPLVLGCALDASGNPYRYAKATINYICVKWL